MSVALRQPLGRVQRRATAALVAREALRVARVAPQTVGAATLTGLLYLLIFGGALAERLGRVDGVAYASFVVPGLVVMTAVAQAFGGSSTSFMQARADGHLDALLTTPLRPWQLAAGYVAGGALRGLVAGAVVGALGSALAGAPADPLLALAAPALATLAAAAGGLVAGIWAQTFDQQSMLAMLVVQPLAMLGGVFYSANSLPAGWQRAVRLDPLFYLVDAARAGFAGVHEAPPPLSLSLAALVGAAVFLLAVALLESGWRTRP